MPLDPEVEVFLKQAAAMPAMETLSVDEARRQMEVSSALLGAHDQVAEVRELSATGPAGPIGLRLYRPNAARPRPCIVFFHGGGWVIGSVESHDGYCRMLANRVGAVVVSVEYRLAPEHRYPAAADDAYAATCWIAAHAEELGIDAARLAVAGDSAGGNLAAVVALRARDQGGPKLAFQLLIYPVIDCSFDTASYRELADGYFLTRPGMQWFWRQYLADERQANEPSASPLRAASLGGLPPALVMTAEYDPLRDEGEAYARKLSEAGVTATLRRYDGVIHGFARRYNTWPTSRLALDETVAELRRALAT